MADLHVREKKLARVAPLSGPSVTIIILWLWGNIFACGAVTKFGIFKFLAVGVKADRLKPVRHDFQSVYFFIERREGTFYKLEPWNKRKYVRPSRLRRIDAFDSILSASFVAILLSPKSTSPGAELPTFGSYIIQYHRQYTQSDTVEARLDGMA